MDVPSDPVRGTLVKESAHPVPRALSRRTQPSRQEQRATLPRPSSACARSATWHPLSRTSRRPTPILQSRRMNILTKRDGRLPLGLFLPPGEGLLGTIDVAGQRVRQFGQIAEPDCFENFGVL